MSVLVLRPSLHRCLFTATPTLTHKHHHYPLRQLITTQATTTSQTQLPPAPKFNDLPQDQQQQIDQYLDLLAEWNSKMNLTAIKQREEAYERHVNDSLALLPVIEHYVATLDLSGNTTNANTTTTDKRLQVIDVGSGAGLPGFMLAIARPQWDFTLLDSLQKRCTFMTEVVSSVDISNVEIECDRAESAGQNPLLRQRYDVVVARAVAELRVLAELCLPFVAKGGYWIAAKGANPQQEVLVASKALDMLGSKLVAIHEVDSDAPEGKRTAIVVKKVRDTPAKYPRKPGLPKRSPL